ncbi:uncharacterized protein LOC130552612 [Triplophysa rosa]|uniref:uncharacterized protein LOC130552612 n=1 Tax=Triplophysa rosa TaxID=992332 RepID=UPI00254610C4|nr:uncharacterized protein LOC130552612 [Triplophysa rosa]
MSGREEEILSGPPPGVGTPLRLGPRPLGVYTPISGASSRPGALLEEKAHGVARSGTCFPFLKRDWKITSPPSTLEVYVAATAAHHDPVAGKPLGQHNLVIRFLRGHEKATDSSALRTLLRPRWRASRGPPFDPLGAAALSHLTIKTALLMALTSKRVGDLQAPSMSTDCLELWPGVSHVILRPRSGYVPKVPTTTPRDQVVNLQALPTGEEDPTRSVLCPVRALRLYLDRTQSFRSSEQLLSVLEISRRGGLSPNRGDALDRGCRRYGIPISSSPLPIRSEAHSSWALAQGTSLADICRAAGWATPNTFARF